MGDFLFPLYTCPCKPTSITSVFLSTLLYSNFSYFLPPFLGSAKFIIHRIEIIDATGNLPEGPATPAGVILTCWNPDGSYEREPVLRVVTTMGVPTRTHTVFEHLDTSLHPLSLHLTESIAVACWEYFFPKEDAKMRQEAFTQSVGSSVGGGGRNRRGSVPADQSRIGAHNSYAGENTAAAAAAAAAAAGSSSMPSPMGSRGVSFTSGGEYPGASSRHPSAAGGVSGGGGGGSGLFRSSGSSHSQKAGHNSLGETTDFSGLDPGAGLLGHSPSGASTPSAGSTAGGGGNSMRSSFGRSGASGGGGGGVGTSAAAAVQSVGGGSNVGGTALVEKRGNTHTSGRGRKRFVYVKLNRAHMRITYQGYPM